MNLLDRPDHGELDLEECLDTEVQRKTFDQGQGILSWVVEAVDNEINLVIRYAGEPLLDPVVLAALGLEWDIRAGLEA